MHFPSARLSLALGSDTMQSSYTCRRFRFHVTRTGSWLRISKTKGPTEALYFIFNKTNVQFSYIHKWRKKTASNYQLFLASSNQNVQIKLENHLCVMLVIFYTCLILSCGCCHVFSLTINTKRIKSVERWETEMMHHWTSTTNSVSGREWLRFLWIIWAYPDPILRTDLLTMRRGKW